MDHSTSLIALALVIWAACLACNCEKVSSKSYLNFPTDLSTDFHIKIAAALKKIVVKDPHASIEWFDEAIRKAAKETDSETDEKVYSDLIRLGLGYVDGRLWEMFLSVCAQAEVGPDSGLEPWKNYLKNNGQDRFSSYLSSTLKYGFWITDENLNIKREMDQVFAAAFNMKGDLSQQELELELAEKLRGFDLTDGKSFNAKKMIRTIREITGDKSAKDEFSLLKNFMLGSCKRFMAHDDLNEVIIRMDLLRYLDSSTMVDDSDLKCLDEYHRLCLALETPNTSDLIRDNLKDRPKHKLFGF